MPSESRSVLGSPVKEMASLVVGLPPLAVLGRQEVASW